MVKRLRQAGRWFLSLVSFPFQLLFRMLRMIGKQLWRVWGRLGISLRRLIGFLLSSAWHRLGRLGIALRKIIAALTWRPARWLLRRLTFLARFMWLRLGLFGSAMRSVLGRTFWSPLLFITTPLRWLYRRTLYRPFSFAWLSLRTFGQWLRKVISTLIEFSVAALRARWTGTVPFRARLRRRVRSRRILWQARARVWLNQPRPSRTIAIAPPAPLTFATEPAPRFNRFTTALVTTSLVLLLGFITTQVHQPAEISAGASPLSEPTPLAGLTQAEATLIPTGPSATAPPVSAIQLTPWPTPDPLSSGGSLAYSLRQDGNSDIFALTLGRSKPVRLTSNQADDRDPVWSPDGRRLAFASNRDGNWDIYILDLPSGEVRRLTNDLGFDAAPSWSPDGEWLVYEAYRQSNLDLYIIRADGSGSPIRLTEHPSQDFSPVWAPGGRHIAFTSRRSGNKDIFIMSLDSASDESALNVTLSPDRLEDHPSFEPNGRYLAYYDDTGGFELVYVQPLENYRPSEAPASVGQGRHPGWSPDGNSLVYVYDSNGQSHLIASSIDAWSVAPQAFSTDGHVDDLNWTAVILPQELPLALQQIAEAVPAPLYVEEVHPPAYGEGESGPPYLLWQLAVDAPSPYLSDKVDQSFAALRQRVEAEVGWDFLGRVDNMYQTIDARPLPGQSSRSWDKAGRAFDFYFRYPLSDEPQVEIVREDIGHQTLWRVYLRTAVQDGTQGEPLRQLPWDFRARYGFDPQYYDQGGKLKDELPEGYYVDFTTLAADYGWTRVPAAESWRTLFQGIRYWRFENHQDLSWEEAMLEIFPRDEFMAAFGSQ